MFSVVVAVEVRGANCPGPAATGACVHQHELIGMKLTLHCCWPIVAESWQRRFCVGASHPLHEMRDSTNGHPHRGLTCKSGGARNRAVGEPALLVLCKASALTAHAAVYLAAVCSSYGSAPAGLSVRSVPHEAVCRGCAPASACSHSFAPAAAGSLVNMRRAHFTDV